MHVDSSYSIEQVTTMLPKLCSAEPRLICVKHLFGIEASG